MISNSLFLIFIAYGVDMRGKVSKIYDHIGTNSHVGATYRTFDNLEIYMEANSLENNGIAAFSEVLFSCRSQRDEKGKLENMQHFA